MQNRYSLSLAFCQFGGSLYFLTGKYPVVTFLLREAINSNFNDAYNGNKIKVNDSTMNLAVSFHNLGCPPF